ncbi:hypothetical protein [uncultured Oscillibacter sp.]|uniref:hypothetical protein n=1 Tax=uncultured Oscillibacter sp. TaxID=876091 RepID=UPI002628D004|nr:hypothetical protein [uncultured Oscillibacter sp.]
MEINTHRESKLVDIWLSHEDQSSQDVQERLQNIYRRFAEEKYTVAVFYSGRQDLAEETGALLRYNRRRSAEQAVQREKARKRQVSR